MLKMSSLLFIVILIICILLACCLIRRCCRSNQAGAVHSVNSAPSEGPGPAPSLSQSASSNAHYIYAGHHALGPGGSVWVPEPNSIWQPLANQHQATWASGPNQGTQNQTQQRFALAPSMPHLADLPPSYDEAVMGKAQGPGLQYSERTQKILPKP